MDEITNTNSATDARPSKRSRSMRGNFNAVRNPWLTFWRRRALPPEKRWVLRLVEDYVPSLVADKGGPDNVSYAEMKVIETAAVARACWALAMADGDLDAVARFLVVEQHALKAIGLERRAKPAPRLADILAGASKVG